MYIIFSPAKSQQASSVQPFTAPPLAAKSKILLRALATLSVQQLQKHFKISVTLAEKLYDNYRNPTKAGNAISTYTGTAYSRIDVETFDQSQWLYAQKHVRILSALYGILRPCDKIHIHRLDMKDSTNWLKNPVNLYHYWKEPVNSQLESAGVILNLASDEYAAMITPNNKTKIIDVSFMVKKDKSYKTVAVFSKQQRGSLLHYCIVNKIKDHTALQSYHHEGFTYNQILSSPNKLVFCKSQ